MAASASLVVPVTPAFNSWSSAQLTADVQLFLDQPGDNHGWILIGTETANARRFDSRSGPTPANHPMLSIEFAPPVPSLAPLALALLVVLMGLAPAFQSNRIFPSRLR